MSKETRLLHIQDQRVGSTLHDEADPYISTQSRFSDSTWYFYDEIADKALTSSLKRIEWNCSLPNGDSFLMPRYASMLCSLKELAHLLLEGTCSKRLKPTKVVGATYAWKLFVCFLVQRPVPVYRFSDVLPSDVLAFFEHLKSRPGKGGKGTLSTGGMANFYSNLNYLYDFRESLTDGLSVRPSGEQSARAAANHNKAQGVRTRFIPDEEAKILVDEAVKYIETYAPILFDCWKQLLEWKNSKIFRELYISKRAIYINKLLREYRHDVSLGVNTPFSNGFKNIHAYESELVRLRTACFILIGFSTGMRISEIASIKAGCIGTEQVRNHGTFYWITGLTFKTERSKAAAVRKWMCGRLAARAVEVLERMSVLLGANKETPYLFTTLEQVIGARRRHRKPFKPVTKGCLDLYLKKFCSHLNLKIYIHPHMFRRTFARNVVRVDGTSLLALKEHFKHWSLYMTDWYVGLDPDLISEYEAERQILSIELMEKICASRVSGPGGRRWTIELQKRIKDGRLPKNFRGKAGSEFRKNLIRDIHRAGSVVIPCGDFTYCIFNKDSALCTQGHRPATNKCNPLECRNSYITEEHVPFHKMRLTEKEIMYHELSGAEKESPQGEAYRREIIKLRKILEPFENKAD